jgi:DNA primase
MARIPDAELERLKRETDLVALVQAAGVELRRHGADLVGRCPFHDDRGPSLVVTPAKGLWHCLGACQAGGSAIDWVMRSEKVSFRHAVERLLAREGRAPATAPLVPVAKGGSLDVDDDALLKQVVDYYHETLKASPEAIAYLESRGLNDVALIDRFRLGFANRTLGYRLPKTALKAGAAVRTQLQRVGILRASGHEHLRGSVVVPILGERGRVAQCYGRKITPHLREGTPDHLYLPGPAHGRVERRGAGRREGDHPLRGALGRDDLLGRGPSERDHELRRERLHRGAPRRAQAPRDDARADRLRCRCGG